MGKLSRPEAMTTDNVAPIGEPARHKVTLTLDDLRALRQRAANMDAWADVALEWMAAAQAEIERLKSERMDILNGAGAIVGNVTDCLDETVAAADRRGWERGRGQAAKEPVCPRCWNLIRSLEYATPTAGESK